MADEWRDELEKKLVKLLADRNHIQELNARLRFQGVVNGNDEIAFFSVLEYINKEIEFIKWELALDDLLSTEGTLNDFLSKHKDK